MHAAFRRRLRAVPFAVLAACVAPGSVHTQGAARDPRLAAALDTIRAGNEWTLTQQASICEIPAPPFKERARAREFQKRLEAWGLANVRIDAEGNVIGERRGTGSGPVVVLSGHLDTVFPEGTDVRVRRDGDMMRGPGIGDDCRGLAVILAVARAFERANVRTPGTIYFVGTVGEEGPGNLRGVRHLLGKELAGRVNYFISVDGTGFGITSRAVGSHRYRVVFSGPGGHSYGHFGIPNPIHALGRAIAGIAELQVPTAPRTTFSVGIIEGGTSVNSIAAEASFDVDLRSESAEALNTVDAAFRRTVQSALAAENARWPAAAERYRLTVRIDTVGIRPAGAQPDTARIVRVAQQAARALRIDAPPPNASSTDSNYPISVGIPAITIDGGGRGRGAHSLEESYEDGPDGYRGPQWAALVAAMLAGGG
ncbi:MAG TPA: M20/M25/M40 family metallo-hydrolase [Gemmatimonadaceae bacterium]|nr:M20/M25/M40 family metallo-hydrolase [Gemmatimonadaceae bacterium]